MLLLGSIFQKFNIFYDIYADGTKIYLPLQPEDISHLNSLLHCLLEVQPQMRVNFLQPNLDKMEVFLLCPSLQLRAEQLF